VKSSGVADNTPDPEVSVAVIDAESLAGLLRSTVKLPVNVNVALGFGAEYVAETPDSV
jgi:hypothetical protein